MKGLKQLVLSGTIGSTASVVDLYVADRLDPIIGTQRANQVGLIIDNIIDFVGQQLLFLGGIGLRRNLTIKFIISKVITTLAAEILFDYAEPTLEKKYPDNHTEEAYRIKLAELRTAINITVFFILTYPMRRYWVFIK